MQWHWFSEQRQQHVFQQIFLRWKALQMINRLMDYQLITYIEYIEMKRKTFFEWQILYSWKPWPVSDYSRNLAAIFTIKRLFVASPTVYSHIHIHVITTETYSKTRLNIHDQHSLMGYRSRGSISENWGDSDPTGGMPRRMIYSLRWRKASLLWNTYS